MIADVLTDEEDDVCDFLRESRFVSAVMCSPLFKVRMELSSFDLGKECD